MIIKISPIFILCLMLYLHVKIDFHQGILASMKQKEWWKSQPGYDEKYQYDYIMGLLMHSVEWSFGIMFPIALYYKFDVNIFFMFIFLINIFIHGIVDNAKANSHIINLRTDQFIHIMQILITFVIFILMY